MATLSSLVAARGVATMAEVEEAITRQVLHGGDLTTSLLEIVDRTREPALTGVLAEHLGIAPTFSPLPPASPELLRLLPADLARRHTIYPIAWTQRSLTVAVTELLPDEAAGDLSFVLGRSIVQAAAPLVRIREALARDYQVPLDRRMLRLLARLDGQRDPSPSSLPPPRRRRTEDGPLPNVPSIPSMAVPTPVFGGFRRETLAGFAALPKTVRLPSAPPPVARPSDVPPRPTPAEVPVAKRSERPGPLGDAGDLPPVPAPPDVSVAAVGPTVVSAAEASAPLSSPEAEDVPPRPLASPAADAAKAPLVPAPEGSVMGPARAKEVMSWARTAIVHGRSARKRRRGPMSMAEAETGIADATDAPEAIEVFFDFAQQYFEYSALFFLQGDVAGGRDAYGPGADRQKVNGIGIPLDLPSRFAEVRKSGAPWVGRAAREGLEAEVVADLERPAGLPFALVPVVVRGRTVALFYADEGGGVVELSMAGETLSLAGLLAKGLERIAVEKKARRGGTGQTVVDLPKAAPPPDRTTEVVEPPAMRAPLATTPLLAPEHEPNGSRADKVVDVTRPSEMPSTVPGPPSAPGPRSQEPPSTEPEPVAAGAVRGSRPPAPRFLPVSELLAGEGATSTPIAIVTGMEWSRPAPSPPSAPEPPLRTRPDTPRPGPLNPEQAELLRALLAPDARVGEVLPLVVRQGAAMVAALVAALPGPTDVPRASVMAGDARPSHTGPIFRALVALRRVSLPHVIAASASSDTAYRFFSTFLLGELPFEGSPEAIAARLFDPDHDVQRIAVVAARLLGPTRPIAEPVIRRLEDVLGDGADQLSRRRRAASVLGELHARVAVPALLKALDSPIAESAHGALVAITCQDFGTDGTAWMRWWEQQHKKHRVAWLIDALVHRSPDLRVRAAEELRTLAPRSGLSRVATASDEELAELHRRYLTWWRESGHAEAAALDE